MPIPDYDNAVKWGTLFRKLTKYQKIIAIIIVFLIGGIAFYLWLGPYRSLKEKYKLSADNLTKTQNALTQAKEEIGSLRDKNAKLHRENLHLQGLIDPIKKKAELLYPEMETAAAIAKLSQDLQDVRSLAMRDVYRPLSKEQREKLLNALKQLAFPPGMPPLKFSIRVEQGNLPRAKVGSDLKDYLEECGFAAEFTQGLTMYEDVPPNIYFVVVNKEDAFLANVFMEIIGAHFINADFAWTKNENLERGHIEIVINGDPIFTESGIVSFR